MALAEERATAPDHQRLVDPGDQRFERRGVHCDDRARCLDRLRDRGGRGGVGSHDDSLELAAKYGPGALWARRPLDASGAPAYA